MKHKKRLAGMPYLAVAAGVAGYFFRTAQLSGGSKIPLIAFSILMALLFLLAAVSEEKTKTYAQMYRPVRADLICSTLAGLALFASGILTALNDGVFFVLLGIVGAAGGAGLVAAAILRFRDKAPQAVLYVFAILFFVVKLFYDFRHWMIDPAILDYCFLLFALIAFMLSIYHTAAFSFDRGSRRRLVFYALCGVMFGVISMVGGGRDELLVYGSGVLTCLGCAVQAL